MPTYTMIDDQDKEALGLYLADLALSAMTITQEQYAWAVDFAAWTPAAFFAQYVAPEGL